jgi:hypothetical protein
MNNTIYRTLAAALLLAAADTAQGQVLYGSLVGNVTDSSAAAVPGVEVQATNASTNQTRTVLTNSEGGYTLPNLAAGSYVLTFSKAGFRPVRNTQILVSINTVIRTDAQLEVGALTESVTVSTDAVALQTDRAEVRAEITSKTLVNVPVGPGRNYQALFGLLPGFTPPNQSASVPGNPSRAMGFSVNGTSGQSNNTRIDGASSTNVWRPSFVAYVPALESIETVNVVTNSFDAEQGLAGGAAISVQIKSGTNALHGSAFEYYNGNATKAKPFFLPVTERKPKDVYNQFGATVGGPVIKDKLFYFTSYEGTFNHRFASLLGSVPTPAMRTGDLSGAPAGRLIFDPFTGAADGSGRTSFPGSLIPVSRMPDAVRKIIPLWPAPTGSGTQNNYYSAGRFTLDRHTIDTKVNYNFSPKFTAFGRYSYLHFNTQNSQFFGPELGGVPIAGGQAGVGSGHSTSLTLAGTYVFTPNFVIDANFGYTRLEADSRQPRLDEQVGRNFLGLPGTNGSRWFEGGWPQLNIANFSILGAPNAFQPNLLNDPQYQYVANANWTKGSHNLRFGTDIYEQQLNQTQPEFFGAFFGASGGFSFAPGETSLRGGPATSEYNSFASFLLGATDTLGKIQLIPDSFSLKTRLYSFYARDQWQASRKLTISYGVRWEYFPMPSRQERGVERYDFETGKMLVCGVGSVPADCGMNMSKKRFVPRGGLAYRLSETMVLRAGYGITNDPYNLARPLRVNYPVLVSLNLNSPNGFAPASRLADGIPLIPNPDLGNGIIPIDGNVAVNTVDPNNFKRGYIQSWNVAMQKQFRDGWVGEAAYVATRSVGQLAYYDRNVGRVGGGNASRPLFQKFGRGQRTAEITGLGTYKYDSLQAKLERRFSRGLQVGVAYTFSKNMGIAGNEDGDGSPAIGIPEFYDLNWARTTLDRTHNLQIHGIVELPFGRGKKWMTQGFGAAILGGWQINGAASMFTGQPFTVTSPGTSLNAPGNTQRADLVKSEVAKLGGAGPRQKFYDTTAFKEVTDVRFGTAGFNLLNSPGTFNLDTGLFRSFRITEKITAQFRAEAFNFTNTPHFTAPNGGVTSSAFMEVSGVRGLGREGIDERVFRFGLRVAF